MKRGTKIGLIIVLILALVGGGLCITAFALGVNFKEITEMAEKGDFSFGPWGSVSENLIVEVPLQGSEENLSEGTLASGDKYTVADEMGSLVIDLDFGDLTVKSSESDEIYLECGDDEKYFELNVSVNTVHIKNKNKHSWINVTMPKATLYLPESLGFDSVEMDIDAGSCTIEADIFANLLTVDVDAGTADIESMNVSWAEFDCDAGKIEFNGTVVNGGEADVDAGAVIIHLPDVDVTDYNYEIEVSAGAVDIDDRSFSGLDEEQYIQNHARAGWTLTCDAGKIEMNLNK